MAVHLKVAPDGTITITSSPQGEVDVTGITNRLTAIEGLLTNMSEITDKVLADLDQIASFLATEHTAFVALQALDAQKDVQIANLTSTVATDEAKIAADAQALADAQAAFDQAKANADAADQSILDKADAIVASTQTPAPAPAPAG